MTIETQINREEYVGNGVTTVFPINFPVYKDRHLKIFAGVDADQHELTTGFQVTGAGTDAVNVVFAAPPPAGLVLTILREVPYTQEMKLQNLGDFNPEILMEALDLVVMQTQQLAEESGRSIKFPPSAKPPYPNSADYLNQVKGYADDAKASADRAAAASDPGALASSIYNIRKAWVLTEAVASGDVLELPSVYFPTRNVLTLHYEGVVCSPRGPLVEATAQYQYEEIGDDLNVPSNQVRLFFDAKPGDVFDMQVTHSGLSADVEVIEGLAEDAAEAARSAGDAQAAAEDAARRAEEAASGAEGGSAVRHVTLDAPLAAGDDFAVPSYKVGSGRLKIYYDGVYCRGGGDSEYQYKEVGTAGTDSAVIQFYDDLPAGAQLSAIVG